MPKLIKYSANELYQRVYCKEDWTLNRIKRHLGAHKKRKVDALWIANNKDIRIDDRLWVIIAEWTYDSITGIAPKEIAEEVRESCNGSPRWCWYDNVTDDRNLRRRTLRLLIKKLEEYTKG